MYLKFPVQTHKNYSSLSYVLLLSFTSKFSLKSILTSSNFRTSVANWRLTSLKVSHWWVNSRSKRQVITPLDCFVGIFRVTNDNQLVDITVWQWFPRENVEMMIKLPRDALSCNKYNVTPLWQRMVFIPLLIVKRMKIDDRCHTTLYILTWSIVAYLTLM